MRARPDGRARRAWPRLLASSAGQRRELSSVSILLLLPVVVHWPALIGWLHFDPIYVASGLETGGGWTPNGLLSGTPGWIDGNAGVTTEALGALAAHDWLHGVLPWWNPYSGVGLPLAAEAQNSAFFLPFVLLLALPHGLLALRIVLMALAGLCTRALLRRLGCSTLPAAAGAALFELNGTFAWLAHGPIMPVAFLPLLLLGIEQARDGRRWPPLPITLGIAWSLLAGFPETAFIDGLFALAWATLRLCQAGRPLRYGLCVAAGGTLGLLLAAPGIWPFIEALPRSFLGVHAQTDRAGLLPGSFALLLFPYLYGDILMGLVRLGIQGPLWFSAGGYCDLMLFSLALLGLRLRGPDRALRWTLAAWILLTFSRAANLPWITDLFHAVPVLRQAAFQNYVLPSWSMALAVLASLALEDWCAVRARSPVWVVGIVTVAAAAALWLARPDLAMLGAAVPGYLAFPLASLGSAGAMLGLLAWLWTRVPTQARQLALGLAAIVNAGLLFMIPLLAGTRGRHVDTASVRFLREHVGMERVVSFGPLVPNYGAMFQIAEIGHNYLPVPQAWVDYVRRTFDPGMDGVNFYYGGGPPSEHLEALLRAYERAGVGYALTAPGTQALPGARLARRGAVMDVWKLPAPAAYFQAPGCALTPRSRLRATVDCPQAAELTRLELAWPGWRSRVGGVAAAVHANGIFQRVELPSGQSEVEFGYSPPWIDCAWLAFALGLGLTVAPPFLRRRSALRQG